MGYFYGEALSKGKSFSLKTLLIPVIYHGLYDFDIFISDSIDSLVLLVPFIRFIVAGIVIIILFIKFINRKRKDDSYTRPLFPEQL
jgi:hypothetical protein